MAGRLEGKVCVITGAASGIGADAALRFAEEGARVVGVDLADVRGVDLSIVADVGDEEAVAGLYGEARERFGRIDVPLTTWRRRST